VQKPLIYFTHVIDGRTCGGWYRRLSSSEIEIFAVGLMRRVSCPDGQELVTSRTVLEDFLRGPKQHGSADLSRQDPPTESD
jgi:hypothetical protein